MHKLIGPHDPVIAKIMELLGISRTARSFVVRVAMDQFVEVDVVYYPEREEQIDE